MQAAWPHIRVHFLEPRVLASLQKMQTLLEVTEEVVIHGPLSREEIETQRGDMMWPRSQISGLIRWHCLLLTPIPHQTQHVGSKVLL